MKAFRPTRLNATYILRGSGLKKKKRMPREGSLVRLPLCVYVKVALSENSGKVGASDTTCPGRFDHVKQEKGPWGVPGSLFRWGEIGSSGALGSEGLRKGETFLDWWEERLQSPDPPVRCFQWNPTRL